MPGPGGIPVHLVVNGNPNFLDETLLAYQAGYRGNSWRLSIEEQRYKVSEHLDENPSLRSQLDDLIRRAYHSARRGAAVETGLDVDAFPTDNPFPFDEAMNPDFWPD